MQWDINPVNSETRRIKGLFCFNRSEGNSIIRPHELNATDVPFRDNTHTRLENGGTINRAEALRGVHHQGAKSHKRHGEGGGGGKGRKGKGQKTSHGWGESPPVARGQPPVTTLRVWPTLEDKGCTPRAAKKTNKQA